MVSVFFLNFIVINVNIRSSMKFHKIVSLVLTLICLINDSNYLCFSLITASLS